MRGKSTSDAFEYVKEKSHNICLEAVSQDGQTIKYIKDQTDDIRLIAVDIRLIAVSQNGHALAYVENQTSEICLSTVRSTYEALEYVKDQTLEICD